MMIFSGPSTPKLMAEAWVVSENVGEGGPGDDGRFGDSVKLRSERFFRGMTVDGQRLLWWISCKVYSSLFGSDARSQLMSVHSTPSILAVLKLLPTAHSYPTSSTAAGRPDMSVKHAWVCETYGVTVCPRPRKCLSSCRARPEGRTALLSAA